MTDLAFLFNRKGALYPVDYTSTSIDWPNERKIVPSLVHLSAKAIVSDSTLTEKVSDVVPPELFIPLFKASLYPVRDAAIDILINKWPFRSLVLSNYAKKMFSSIVLLYNELELCQRTRLGVKYSADIVHGFIEALRKRHTKLRQLDLTGFPIAELIIKYVATHSRLAQKEHQRNCLIDEYLQNVSDLEKLSERPTAIRNDLKKTTSLPDEQLILRFDCTLQERATFEELMGALNTDSQLFQLQITKLDLLCLGKSNIIKLLSKLDKNFIEGVRLQYNSLTEESIRDLIPVLSELKNLRALDLSCNLIDYRQNPESCRMMSLALQQLKLLNRVDLSGSPLGGCLYTLLSSLELPLEYLGLHSCGLLESDLRYIAQSEKHSQVKHLDLSDNRLARHMDSLLVLMRACGAHLYALELDDNSFDSIDYLNVVNQVRKMKQIRLLATKGTFETNDQLVCSQFLQQSETLVAWRISYPIDVYDANSSELSAQQAAKDLFVQKMMIAVKNRFKVTIHELFM